MAASASLWSTAVAQASLLSTELNALAAAAVGVSSGSAYNNTSIRHQYAMLELNVDYVSAPTDGDFITVYFVPAADLTNYDDVTDPINPGCIVANILLRATTAPQKIAQPIQIPGPFNFKVALKNNGAQPFPATGSTLMITAYDNEQQ